MVSNLNFTPSASRNVNFGKKSEAPKSSSAIIEEAYKIANDVPDKEKFFSPGADLAFPAIFGLKYAYDRSNFKLSRLINKAYKATISGNVSKATKLTEKVNATKSLIGDGNAVIKAVTNPKAAFKEYFGRFTLLMNTVTEGVEVFKTAQQLGTKAALKQAGRGIANALGSTFGWVAGSVIGHKVASKVCGAVGGLIGGPAGRFVGNLVGNVIGFLGGILGERAMRKGGEKIYGKSELTQAQEAKTEKDLKNLDLNDKTTLKQQIIKNQLWLQQYADESGNISLTGSKKVDEKIETVAKAIDELNKKFKAAGGTDEELMAAAQNPEETFAEQNSFDRSTNMRYSGAFNSATANAKGDPRFNGYSQKVFA